MILALVVGLLLVGADQGIKAWVAGEMMLGESRGFLSFGSEHPLLNLTYVRNSGAAFSSLSGQRVILIALPVILLVICALALRRYGKDSRFLTWGLTLVMSGGVGNLIDRVFRGGSVVDYLDLQLFEFPVFNFADCCVCIGAALVLIYFLFLYKEPEAPKKEQEHV